MSDRTSECQKELKSIYGETSKRFISFDVVGYYLSITEELLNKALDFASQFHKITQEERDIITHAKSHSYTQR